jgi:hypothetical protein
VTQGLARRAWTLFEPIHAIVYFTPEATEHYKAAGLRGSWMGYFASRSAAMGAVGPDVVTAVFHNFRPAMVSRALPDAWGFSTPERVLAARLAVADSALRRLWGDEIDSAEVTETAEAMMSIAGRLQGDGRPLYSAHAALPVPDAPSLALWHACTLLREHRFDGHIATLTVSGVDGLDSLVIANAAGLGMNPATIQRMRGWTEEETGAAAERLRSRGILDRDNALTMEGRALKGAIEETTDNLASEVWETLEAPERERLFEALFRLSTLLEGPDGIRYPNPIGVERPV